MNKSTPEKDELVAALGRAIVRWQDATQQYDEVVGEIYGLSATERHCLSFLWLGPQTPSAIARAIRLTPAAVTTLLDRLETRGFVRRTADPDDRRKTLVAFAEAALRLTAEAYEPMARAGAVQLAKHTEAELRVVAAVLSDSMVVQEEMTRRLLERARSQVVPRL